MKIYIAHNYEAREWINSIVTPQLKDLGIEITSTWLQGAIIGKAETGEEDCRDVARADCLLYFATKFNDRPGLGKHIEFGYALGLNKQIIIIGEDTDLTSVFHHIRWDNIIRYSTFHEFLDYLRMAIIFVKI